MEEHIVDLVEKIEAASRLLVEIKRNRYYKKLLRTYSDPEKRRLALINGDKIILRFDF